MSARSFCSLDSTMIAGYTYKRNVAEMPAQFCKKLGYQFRYTLDLLNDILFICHSN